MFSIGEFARHGRAERPWLHPQQVQVVSGVLPAGRYATLVHVGHPSQEPDMSKWLTELAFRPAD
jgi:hypothetical protein